MVPHYTTLVTRMCLEVYNILTQEMPIAITSNNIPTITMVTLIAVYISLFNIVIVIAML